MLELLKSNNPADIAFAKHLLKTRYIEVFELDVHISNLEGSISLLPIRLMVSEKDIIRAREVLMDNNLLLDKI